MLIKPEGEGDFFDVGHSKNCIRPKAKKHVTEYPHIYIYIYIYGSTKKINDRDTQKSMTSEDQHATMHIELVLGNIYGSEYSSWSRGFARLWKIRLFKLGCTLLVF